MTTKRLDTELVSTGLYSSRNKALAAIKNGLVTVNGIITKKPSQRISETDKIESSPLPYISGRGSLKLSHALNYFHINPKNYRCLDVGASTGGFTEILLSHGAASIIAVDVGTNQLVPEIRNNPRVISMEQTDIRTLPPCSQIDLIVIDVSFISLTNIASAVAAWNAPHIVALIKPQFEVSREISAKTNGIIKSEELRNTAITTVVNCFQSVGYTNHGITTSPIHGGSGNIEFLAYFTKTV